MKRTALALAPLVPALRPGRAGRRAAMAVPRHGSIRGDRPHLACTRTSCRIIPITEPALPSGLRPGRHCRRHTSARSRPSLVPPMIQTWFSKTTEV